MKKWDYEKAMKTLGVKRVPMKPEDEKNAFASTGNDGIAINPEAPPDQLEGIMIHELGHAVLKHTADPFEGRVNWWQHEAEAYEVTRIVIKRLKDDSLAMLSDIENREVNAFENAKDSPFFGIVPMASGDKILEAADKIYKAGLIHDAA